MGVRSAHAYLAICARSTPAKLEMFPRRAALVAALTGAVVYWTTGLGPAAALAVSLTTFLPLGGARYLSLLYRVLPRDVK